MKPEPKHTYTVAVGDVSCACLPTISSFLRALLGETGRPDAPGLLRDFLAFHEACLGLRNTVELRDDARASEARVIVVPDVERPRLALLWRDDSTATAYVASEVPMPWLAMHHSP